MAKTALLVGVSHYESGLSPLLGALEDVEAMQRVLEHPEMGGFDQVKPILNPDVQTLQGEIENLFVDRAKDDLVLLFFSGHGLKDDYGRLYFATRITRKTAKGGLVKSTAVPASFVHEIMDNCRSKRQVVILDCCFSGAFAEGMKAKDDGALDIQTLLGGEGRVVLTSSTSTQYSFEQFDNALSVYTRYIVEGIETGAADADTDGMIAIEELHDYARKKVSETAPAMKPKIYAVEEGFRIILAKAPIEDPKLHYRREVERLASRGLISEIGRYTLDALRTNLDLSIEETGKIEAEVLKPFQDYQRKLQQYEQVLVQVKQREYPFSPATEAELERFRAVLGLRAEDIRPIAARLTQHVDSTLVLPLPDPLHSPEISQVSPDSLTVREPANASIPLSSVSPPAQPATETIPNEPLLRQTRRIGCVSVLGIGCLSVIGAISLYASQNRSIKPHSLPTVLQPSDKPSPPIENKFAQETYPKKECGYAPPNYSGAFYAVGVWEQPGLLETIRSNYCQDAFPRQGCWIQVAGFSDRNDAILFEQFIERKLGHKLGVETAIGHQVKTSPPIPNQPSGFPACP
jgi:hypothetical protein